MRQFMAKTCLMLLAGGLAAQHTTLLVAYDVLCLSLFASFLALTKRRLRIVALPVLGWTLFMLSGLAIVEGRLDSRYAGDSMLVKVRVLDFPRWSGSAVSMTPRVDAGGSWPTERGRARIPPGSTHGSIQASARSGRAIA